MKIVFLDAATLDQDGLDWSVLDNLGDFIRYDRTKDVDFESRARDADILITNKHAIDAFKIKQCTSLQLICVAATGYNNVDVKEATVRSIPVCNVAGYSTKAVVQHVWSCISFWTNQIVEYADSVRRGEWHRSLDFSYLIHPIPQWSDLTIGILGHGTIAKELIRICQAFGMKILIHSSYPEVERTDVRFVGLKDLFASADILSIHSAFDESKRNLVSNHLLGKMKSSAILINTARGGFIDEEALFQALEKKKLAAAFLDVLNMEPPRENHPLYQQERCYISPHIAWAGSRAKQYLIQGLEGNIKAFKSGEIRNQVN